MVHVHMKGEQGNVFFFFFLLNERPTFISCPAEEGLM